MLSQGGPQPAAVRSPTSGSSCAARSPTRTRRWRRASRPGCRRRSPSLGEHRAGRLIVDIWQMGRTLAWAAWASVLVGLALLILGIALAPRRALALRRASLDIALGGLVLFLLVPAGRALVKRDARHGARPAGGGGAVRRVTRAACGCWRLALGGGGLVFSAAAHSLVGRAWLAETPRGPPGAGSPVRRPRPRSSWCAARCARRWRRSGAVRRGRPSRARPCGAGGRGAVVRGPAVLFRWCCAAARGAARHAGGAVREPPRAAALALRAAAAVIVASAAGRGSWG